LVFKVCPRVAPAANPAPGSTGPEAGVTDLNLRLSALSLRTPLTDFARPELPLSQ
jgi:hypothetical protein